MATDPRQQYLPIVQREAARAGIPWQLLDAMIQQESGYNAGAIGDRSLPGQAVGFGQLRPGAAADVGLSSEQRYDPLLNLRGTADYAALAYRNAGGNWDETAARYNAGAYRRPSAESSAWQHAARVRGHAGRFGHAWGGDGAAAAPTAAQTLALGSVPAVAPRGIDYPQPPQLPSIATELNLPEPTAAPRQSRPMSLQEILGYGNIKLPSWYAG